MGPACAQRSGIAFSFFWPLPPLCAAPHQRRFPCPGCEWHSHVHNVHHPCRPALPRPTPPPPLQTLIAGMIIVVCGSVFSVFVARKSLQAEEEKGRLPKVGCTFLLGTGSVGATCIFLLTPHPTPPHPPSPLWVRPRCLLPPPLVGLGQYHCQHHQRLGNSGAFSPPMSCCTHTT